MSYRYGDGTDSVWIATQAISGTTPVVSRVISLREANQVAMQMVTTGTITGTWLIEGSNNYVATGVDSYGQIATSGEWTTITPAFVVDSGTTAIANPAGSALEQPAWNKDPLGWRDIRITFTPASGAGNVTLLGYVKGWG